MEKAHTPSALIHFLFWVHYSVKQMQDWKLSEVTLAPFEHQMNGLPIVSDLIIRWNLNKLPKIRYGILVIFSSIQAFASCRFTLRKTFKLIASGLSNKGEIHPRASTRAPLPPTDLVPSLTKFQNPAAHPTIT